MAETKSKTVTVEALQEYYDNEKHYVETQMEAWQTSKDWNKVAYWSTRLEELKVWVAHFEQYGVKR